MVEFRKVITSTLLRFEEMLFPAARIWSEEFKLFFFNIILDL